MLGSHCSNQGRLPGGIRVVAAESLASRNRRRPCGRRSSSRTDRDRRFEPSSSMPLSASASAAVIRVSGMFLSWPGKSVATSTVAPKQQAIGNSGDAREPADAARARLHRPPDRFSIAADGRHDADAGDHDPIVAQAARIARYAHAGRRVLGRIRQSSRSADAVIAAWAEAHSADAPHDDVLARRSILKNSAECHVRFTKERRDQRYFARLIAARASQRKNLRMSHCRAACKRQKTV